MFWLVLVLGRLTVQYDKDYHSKKFVLIVHIAKKAS
jgi:hypothetical protein